MVKCARTISSARAVRKASAKATPDAPAITSTDISTYNVGPWFLGNYTHHPENRKWPVVPPPRTAATARVKPAGGGKGRSGKGRPGKASQPGADEAAEEVVEDVAGADEAAAAAAEEAAAQAAAEAAEEEERQAAESAKEQRGAALQHNVRLVEQQRLLIAFAFWRSAYKGERAKEAAARAAAERSRLAAGARRSEVVSSAVDLWPSQEEAWPAEATVVAQLEALAPSVVVAGKRAAALAKVERTKRLLRARLVRIQQQQAAEQAADVADVAEPGEALSAPSAPFSSTVLIEPRVRTRPMLERTT